MIAMDAATRASVDAMWARLGIPVQGVAVGRAAPRSVVPHATDVGATDGDANGATAAARATAPDARLAVAAREGRGPAEGSGR
jgi:hypothetical protein